MTAGVPVRANCPDCGPVAVARSAVRLICSDQPAACRYEFRCPRCFAWVLKPADRNVIVLLTGLVPMVHETRPAELAEPHTGGPITLDDLIDLGREMAVTDLLARHAGRS